MKLSTRSSFCLFCIIIGCASAPPPAEAPASAPAEPATFQCPAGELQGSGFGTAEGEALDMAHAELAKQVNLSIKVTVENTASQRRVNGEENASSEYISKTAMESSLQNAHDARVAYKKQNGNRINITVCMSRADAAKGFLEKQRLLSDSLELVFNAVLKTKHPKHKNDVWHRTQMLWNEFARVQSLLEGWGIENAGYFGKANEIYSQAKKDYKEYCKGMIIHWEDSGNECSGSAFAMLSGKIKMEKSECSGGLKLNFACTEKCASVSYGIKCAIEPSLSVESCDGEMYSTLTAKEPVSASDMNSEGKAKARLLEELRKADFFNEWEHELKEWMPQCTE